MWCGVWGSGCRVWSVRCGVGGRRLRAAVDGVPKSNSPPKKTGNHPLSARSKRRRRHSTAIAMGAGARDHDRARAAAAAAAIVVPGWSSRQPLVHFPDGLDLPSNDDHDRKGGRVRRSILGPRPPATPSQVFHFNRDESRAFENEMKGKERNGIEGKMHGKERKLTEPRGIWIEEERE